VEVPDFVTLVIYLIYVIICYSHMIFFCINILSNALGIRAFVLKPVNQINIESRNQLKPNESDSLLKK
jgi:hypothetical protein